MEWMVVLMVALLVMGGHHGFGGAHDAKPSTAGAPHVQMDEAAAPAEKEKP